MNELEALQEAISRADGQTALANKLTQETGEKVSQQRVSHWVKSKRVAGNWAIPVEKVTGVHRSLLRPDLYPADEYAA